MEEQLGEQQSENQVIAANEMYEYAAKQLIDLKSTPQEVKTKLMDKGLDDENASAVVVTLVQQIDEAKRKGAKNDMMWGAIWCVGGLIATFANLGYFFWGAILFGGYQFIRGAVANSKLSD